MLNGGPGHKTVEKIKTIAGDTFSIRFIRGPVSVGHSAIAYKATNGSWYDTPIKIKLKIKIKSASNITKNMFASKKMSARRIGIKLSESHDSVRNIRTG